MMGAVLKVGMGHIGVRCDDSANSWVLKVRGMGQIRCDDSTRIGSS